MSIDHGNYVTFTAIKDAITVTIIHKENHNKTNNEDFPYRTFCIVIYFTIHVNTYGEQGMESSRTTNGSKVNERTTIHVGSHVDVVHTATGNDVKAKTVRIIFADNSCS